MLPLFERKELEVKHHAWSDPAVRGQVERDRQFAEKLQADENRRIFNNNFPANGPIRANPAIPIINIHNPPPNQPNQNAEIARLQDRLNKVEAEDKEMQDRLRNALVLENPRLLQAFYPSVRPIYNPSAIVDAAILAELSKKEQSEQTYRKLKELYGEDAPAKYLNRAIARIDAERPPQMIEPNPKPRHKSRSRSPSKSKSKPKSPPRHKHKTRPKSPPKKRK
jgi:hypothetical protein